MPDIKPIQRKLDDQIQQATSRDGFAPVVLTLSPEELQAWRDHHSAPTGELVYRGVPIDDPIDDAMTAYAEASTAVGDEMTATPDGVDWDAPIADDQVTPRGFIPARRADIVTDDALKALGVLDADSSSDNVYVSTENVAAARSTDVDVGKLGDVKVRK